MRSLKKLTTCKKCTGLLFGAPSTVVGILLSNNELSST